MLPGREGHSNAAMQRKDVQVHGGYWQMWVLLRGAHRALYARCAKSRLFSTTSSHRSQGPEFCTPDAVLNGSCRFCRGVVSGVFPG